MKNIILGIIFTIIAISVPVLAILQGSSFELAFVSVFCAIIAAYNGVLEILMGIARRKSEKTE